MDECLTCRNTADPDAPPRERILLTEHWRAAHAFDTALPGWLILAPVRHVRALDELGSDEAAELGPLLRDLTSALRTVTGCEKTYVMLLAEQEGFAHLHFHVVPRAPGLDPELRGARIFALLGVPAVEQVSADDQDALARRLRAALSAADP